MDNSKADSLIANDKAPKGTKRATLRKWILKLTLILTIITPLIFIIAALGVKMGLWNWQFGLGVLTQRIGPAALLLTALFGLISLILAAVISPRKGFFTAGLALLIALGGLVRLGGTVKTVKKLPFIHDVTTDTQDVPMFSAAMLKARAQSGDVNSAKYVGKRDKRDDQLVSVLQTKAYPNVHTLIVPEGPRVVFGKAEAIASGLGWDIVTKDVEAGMIEATDTTFWYGFKDDIIIRLRPSEGGGTVVDLRSLSRVGESDIGKNAARINAFLNKLKAA